MPLVIGPLTSRSAARSILAILGSNLLDVRWVDPNAQDFRPILPDPRGSLVGFGDRSVLAGVASVSHPSVSERLSLPVPNTTLKLSIGVRGYAAGFRLP